jgi:RNA polymerase sigma factor (sigma-70 family)
MTPTTYDTTYDQAYSYADLMQVPRLSEQQRRDLLTRFPAARSQSRMTEEQQQFVESYLRLARHLVIELCPAFAYHRLFPDLIGAASLALVEIAMSRGLANIEGSPTPYVAARLRSAIREALANENLIQMDGYARIKAKAEGQAPVFRVASLDAVQHWDQDDAREEPYATPILPSRAPEPDPIKRARVEQYLGYLPARTQTILRLRFGLDEDDGHAYSVIEIATCLGLTREVVNHAIHDGMARLRALVEGKATIRRHRGRTCISYFALDDHPTSEGREAALLRAYAELQAEGGAITGRSLARAARVSVDLAQQFLRVHREELPEEIRARERKRRLEEAYQRLVSLGKPFGATLLGRAAHVNHRAASLFLGEQRGKSNDRGAAMHTVL